MAWSKTPSGIIFFVFEQRGDWIEVVSAETGILATRLAELADFGAVYLNDKRVLSSQLVDREDYLRIHTRPKRFRKIDVSKAILFESEDLIIIDKESGIPCHPSLDNLKENFLFYLKAALGVSVLPTHRLDVGTSGLLVFAKTSWAQVEFQALLSERKIEKIYSAKVNLPGPDVGFYEHHVEKTSYAPKTMWEIARPYTQICQLRILNNTHHANYAEIQIELLTGRTHQIRAQLAFLGFPILKDSMYGGGTAEHKTEANTENPDDEAEGETEGESEEQFELRCIQLQFEWKNQELNFQLS